MMETFLSVCLGVGLAAACGFRVFVPLLALNLAARFDFLDLAGGFDWVASTPALVILVVATLAEIAAYYLPWIDNALDTLASPLAVIAGVLVTASVLTDMSPVVRWSLALIAGGTAAGTVQGLTSVTRGASTLATGGLANFAIATAELAGSVFFSVLSLLLPLLAVALLVLFGIFAGRRLATLRAQKRRLAEAGGG